MVEHGHVLPYRLKLLIWIDPIFSIILFFMNGKNIDLT